MLKKLLFVGLLAILTGCATSGKEITNYDDRSVVYTWMNIDEISGNSFNGAWIKQYTPKKDAGFFSLRIEEFKNGYLMYHWGLPAGAHKFDEMRLQSCAGPLCTDSFYTYSFHQSHFGKLRIKEPGVYSLGKVDVVSNSGAFDVLESKNAPNDKEILEYLLTQAPKEYPVIGDRVNQALVSLK